MSITATGTTFTVDNLTVESSSGIAPLSAVLSANIYPNPTKGIVNIDLPYYENTKIRIFNIIGAEVYSTVAQSGYINVDLSKNPDGLYFVEIDNGFNKVTKKINIVK
jgi:hypothetical protein